MGFNGDQRKVILYVELVADRSQRCVQPDLSQTIEEFKLSLAHLTGIPSDLQILVSKGRFLENGDRLMNYELEQDQTIFLVQRSGENTPLLRRTHGLDGSSASDTDPVESPTIADLLNSNNIMPWQDFIAEIENMDTYCGYSLEDFLAKIENEDSYSGDTFPSDSELRSVFLSDNSIDGNASEEVTLEHKFASQLADMKWMGLKDRKKNIRALLESSEDVEKAVQCLLDNPNLDDKF